jgi:predicted ArsR family transcriptional regulator
VLDTLAAAEQPLTLVEVSAATGLHENTLRGHLDALVAAGRVTRVKRPTGGRGRPAWGYLARVPEYAALATALADALEQAIGKRSPEAAAVRGGRAWGERVRSQLDRVDVAAEESGDARARLLLALEHTGFAPELVGNTVRLTQCPLLDAAEAHREVVCGAHLGLIQGVLGETGGVSLVPFAEPGACHVNLAP